MQSEPRSVIAVRPPAALAARPGLFAGLEAAFPVTFRPWAPDAPAPDAVIVVARDPGAPTADELPEVGVPVLVVGDRAEDAAPVDRMRICDDAALDRRLRGISVGDRLMGSPLMPVTGRDDVLAVADAGAAWMRSGAPAPVERVRCPLPELAPDQVLSALLWDAHGSPRAGRVPARPSAPRGREAPPCARPCCSTTPTCAGAATASSTTAGSSTTPTPTATTRGWR